MNNPTKLLSSLFIFVVFGVSFFVPNLVAADHTTTHTIQQLQEQVEQLQARIRVLQQQLGTVQSESVAPVATLTEFARNLSYGASGDDVRKLQEFLAKDKDVYPEKLITGYFGILTKAAVIRFQEKYKNEVLTPVGLYNGTGFIGSLTRAKLNQLISEKSISQPAIISLQPSSGPIGTTVTITGSGFTTTGNKVKFGNLGSEDNPSYSLNSSDRKTLVFTVPSGNYLACWVSEPACLAPAYLTQPGTYGVSVINANGTSNEVSFTVTSS